MKRIEYATFGPGGNSESFYADGKKSTVDAPLWVKNFGLDAYEYEAGNGVAAGDATLKKIGDAAKEHGVLMSLHTPYFISLSGFCFRNASHDDEPLAAFLPPPKPLTRLGPIASLMGVRAVK